MEVPFRLQRGAAQPLQSQLVEQIRREIFAGSLRAGTRLPPSRALANEIGVARNVVVGAYEDLLSEGYLEARRGSGTYVSRGLPAVRRLQPPAENVHHRWLEKAMHAPFTEAVPVVAGHGIEFRIGASSVAPLASAFWRRFWLSVGEQAVSPEPAPGAGHPALREAVANYLGRSRGIVCAAQDVVITSGASQAVDVLVRATISPGDRVAFEDPGYPTVRKVFVAAGAQLIAVPVDGDGIVVERMPAGPRAPLLVYTTPSHQYPLGVRMSVARRVGLLRFAEENDALVVEDDYDSEYRFDAPPLPALAGLDGMRRVAYVGTFSKVLAPALRAGYLVAPPALRDRVERVIGLADYHPAVPVQGALAALITSGRLDRHIRQMRRHYAERRAALQEALRPVGDVARLVGLEAGLHACLEFRSALDPRRVAALAAVEGVVVTVLDDFYLGLPDRRGLVLGYGGLTVEQIRHGGGVLCEAIVGATPAGGRDAS